MTTKGYVDISHVVRKVLKDTGYTNPEYGIDCFDCSVLTAIHEQSQKYCDWGRFKNKNKQQGAGIWRLHVRLRVQWKRRN